MYCKVAKQGQEIAQIRKVQKVQNTRIAAIRVAAARTEQVAAAADETGTKAFCLAHAAMSLAVKCKTKLDNHVLQPTDGVWMPPNDTEVWTPRRTMYRVELDEPCTEWSSIDDGTYENA